MNKEQLKEQIYHYTGKKIEVTDDDVYKVEKFINKTEEIFAKNHIDKLIDNMRHELYLYYQFNYNTNSDDYSCNNSFDKKCLNEHKY